MFAATQGNGTEIYFYHLMDFLSANNMRVRVIDRRKLLNKLIILLKYYSAKPKSKLALG